MKSIGHSIEISLIPQKANWAIGRPKAMMSPMLSHLGQPKFRYKYPLLVLERELHFKSSEPPIQHRSSFDAIIGMDWLAKYQAIIVCDEKIVRIYWGNETLIIHGDGSNRGNATRLSIISCTKTEKYVKKGFPIFLAHITTKEVEDKSKEKRLVDVPVVRDFPEVFPDDLPGLPPIRPVEFQIDLVPGDAPVARA
nr:reverse transcriptase domain-containing protein [Tanacetum cinerariifolium]